MKPLSGLDAAFLAAETRTMHMHVAAVMVLEPPGKQLIYSPPARFIQIRQLVEQRLHLVPAFRQRATDVALGLGQPVWIRDKHFDLDYHLRRVALPAPGGSQELAALAADIASRPLDTGRPLWEMHVVEGLSGGRSALVVKLHHAILDGVSGAGLIAAFLDLGPRITRHDPPTDGADVDDDEDDDEMNPAAPRYVGETGLLRHAMGLLARPPTVAAGAAGVLQRGVGVLVDVVQRNRALNEAGESSLPTPFSAPRTSINGAISSQRRVAFASVPLEDVRIARRVSNATVNDVVLSCVGGALRTLLEGRGERPDKALVALVPLSTRREGDLALGNQVSAMLVSLASSIEDPVARLEAVVAGSRQAKEQSGLLDAELVESAARLAFPLVSRPAARLISRVRAFDHLPPLCNVTVSNVAGPPFALWFSGSRLAELYPLGPIAEGVGLNVTVMSYAGTLYVGMLGCRELVSDIGILPGLFEASVAELVEAATRVMGRSG